MALNISPPVHWLLEHFNILELGEVVQESSFATTNVSFNHNSKGFRPLLSAFHFPGHGFRVTVATECCGVQPAFIYVQTDTLVNTHNENFAPNERHGEEAPGAGDPRRSKLRAHHHVPFRHILISLFLLRYQGIVVPDRRTWRIQCMRWSPSRGFHITAAWILRKDMAWRRGDDREHNASLGSKYELITSISDGKKRGATISIVNYFSKNSSFYSNKVMHSTCSLFYIQRILSRICSQTIFIINQLDNWEIWNIIE